ncbi:MAG: type 1 glutamine amidotransferase domain-containing protein [Rickettsiales bacterium]
MNIFNMSDAEKDNYKPAPIPDRLKKNQRIAVLTADKTEDLECFYPFYRFNEEGYDVDMITPNGGAFEAKHGIGLKQTKSIDQVNAKDYVLLYIPGGKAPQELRKNERVLNFVREFASSGKPIAAICHGPQVLIEADLVKGKQIAGWPEIQKEIEDAGATFVDEALVEDGQFITGRKPGDLHRHVWGTMQRLKASAKKAAA